MSLVADQVVVQLTRMTCGKCHVVFAVPTTLYNKRLSDKEEWFCPNGHCRHFVGKSNATLLQEERERTAALRSTLNATRAERDHHWIERKKTNTRFPHLKERVKAGVCPCCHRTFQQLAKHMAAKHPGFAKEGSESSAKSAVKNS